MDIRVIIVIGGYITVCHSIRLPGIDLPPREPGLPPYIPIQDKAATYSYSPSNRNAIPPMIALPGTLNTDTASPKEAPNTDSLIGLLDKLFGSRDWTALLAKLDDAPRSPTVTASQFQTRSPPITHALPGFYNHQVSGSSVSEYRGGVMQGTTNEISMSMSNAATNEKPGITISPVDYLLNLKTEAKIPGQHAAQAAHAHLSTRMEPLITVPAVVPTPKPDDDTQKMNPKENTRYQNMDQHIDMPQSAQTLKSSSQTNTNQAALFNANQINEAQNTYDPNQPIRAYQSQTGSNPYNVNLKTSYNADEVNQEYLQDVHNSPPGISSSSQAVLGNNSPPGLSSSSQAVFGKGAGGYQFSAYEGSQPALFDASALNRAMFQNQKFNGNNQAGSNQGFPPGTNTVHTLQTNIPSSQNTNTGKPTEHNGPKKDIIQKQTEVTTKKPNSLGQNSVQAGVHFSFIPGNLFPGQKANNGQRNSGNSNSQVPSYLRNMPPNTVAQTFNPNTINQAQQLFNPNARSWMKTRSVSVYNPFGLQFEEDSPSNSTTPPPKEHITTPAVPSAHSPNSSQTTTLPTAPRQNVTLSTGTTTTTSPPPPIITTLIEATSSLNRGTEETHYAGFDPNSINAQQAQNGFVPGQMGPIVGSQGQTLNVDNKENVHSNGLSNSGLNAPNQYSPGSSLNFDISNLLGIGGIGQTLNAGGLGNGGNSMGFNPNAWNNVQASGRHNSTIMNTFGMKTAGFDPNTANAGFGHVLGLSNPEQGSGAAGFGFAFGQSSNSSNTSSSNNGFGFTMGGFDPNAANAGFGAANYGFPGGNSPGGVDNYMAPYNPDALNSGNSPGGVDNYMAPYNPDALNSVAIQNPFKSHNNNSSNGNGNSLMNYFLGITSGQTGSGNSNGGAYESSFIGTFNPDSVNQARYDPDKFNTMQMHFDPVEMLSKNPGMDKDALNGANFDPDKVNSANTHISFSPIDMIASNPGIDRDMVANARYDPSKYPTHGRTESAPDSSRISQTGQNAALFDPFDVMRKLMQSSSGFQPGAAGNQQTIFNPMSMFSKENTGTTTQSTQPTPTTSTSTTAVHQTTSQPVTQMHTEVTSPSTPPTSSTSTSITTTLSTINSSKLPSAINGTTTTPIMQTLMNGTTSNSND